MVNGQQGRREDGCERLTFSNGVLSPLWIMRLQFDFDWRGQLVSPSREYLSGRKCGSLRLDLVDPRFRAAAIGEQHPKRE